MTFHRTIRGILAATLPLLQFVSCDVLTTRNTPIDGFDWAAHFSKPHLLVTVDESYITLSVRNDTARTLVPRDLDWAAQDSGMLKDSSWYYCKNDTCSSWSGMLAYYNRKGVDSLPHYVVVTYACGVSGIVPEKSDTVRLDHVSGYLRSFRLHKSFDITNGRNRFEVTWDCSSLRPKHGLYMVIAIDNGLYGAEYFYSYPNYGNFPETPQPPEGYRFLYGRFNPVDNRFVIETKQTIVPFMQTEYSEKVVSSHDVRVLISHDFRPPRACLTGRPAGETGRRAPGQNANRTDTVCFGTR